MHVISTAKRPVPLRHFLYTGNSKQTSDQLFEIVGDGKKFNVAGWVEHKYIVCVWLSIRYIAQLLEYLWWQVQVSHWGSSFSFGKWIPWACYDCKYHVYNFDVGIELHCKPRRKGYQKQLLALVQKSNSLSIPKRYTYTVVYAIIPAQMMAISGGPVVFPQFHPPSCDSHTFHVPPISL